MRILKSFGVLAVLLFVFSSSAIGVMSVTNEEIAEGAVTDSKITGPISASKIQEGVFAKNAENVILVSRQGGGDFQTLYDAINYISGKSSSYKPYLIKLAPGVHRTSYLEIPSYVTIEGSGQDSTVLEGIALFDALGGLSEPAVKLNGTNIELRDVTIRYLDAYNQNGFHVSTGAILLDITGDALVENVKIFTDVRGLSHDTRSISTRDGSVQLENITVLASRSVAGDVDMVNSSALIDGFDVVPYYSPTSGGQYPFPNFTMTVDSYDLPRSNTIIKSSTFNNLTLSSSGNWQFIDINNSQMTNLNISGSISVELRNSQVDIIDNQYPNNLKHANCFNSLFEDTVVY